MPIPTLETRISLSHLQCVQEQEVVGDDEPYLWTAFFKLDGDTVVLDLIGDRPDDQLTALDCFLRGTCTFVGSVGSHNNLGDTDVAAGDVVGIPADLGTAAFTLKPIPVTPRAQAKLDRAFVDGAVGFVVALMEQDRTSDAGAEAGHAAFSRALEAGINSFLYQDGGPTAPADLVGKLGVVLQVPAPEQIAALQSDVKAAVKHAIREADGASIDHDELIAFKHRFVSTQALVDDGVQEIYEQLAQISNGGLIAEYKLVGDILGIDAGTMSYSWIKRSEEFGTPPAAGVPTTFPFPGLGITDIVYRDTGGSLWELWRNAGGITGKRNLTALATGATKATGNPVAYADTDGGQVMLAYKDADTRHIHTMYWSTGGVGHENLTGSTPGAPRAEGNPIALFVPESRTHHIIYRTVDGHLHVVYWQGGDPAGHEDMTAWAQAPGAAGDASAYYVTASREHIVVYRGTDGHIHDIHWRIETPFQPEDLSAVAGTPPAAGDPFAYHIAAMDLHQMTYLADDGHLYEIYCFGEQAVQGWDLSAAAGAPDAVVTSDPVAYYHAPTNTKHVVYREANDHLYDIQWVPNSGAAPQRIDLTLMALADRAAGKPAAFLGLGTEQHVVYRSAANQIHEILITGPRSAAPAPLLTSSTPART